MTFQRKGWHWVEKVGIKQTNKQTATEGHRPQYGEEMGLEGGEIG